MNKILLDDKALVNVFRNIPVSVVAWYISSDEEKSSRGNVDCAKAGIVINDAFCRMTGYSPREIEARFDGRIGQLVVEEERSSFMYSLHELCQYPHDLSLDSRFVKADGKEIDVKMKLNSVRQADGSMWVYAVVLDAERAQKHILLPMENADMSEKRVAIRTFGYFNVLIDGQPIAFQHEKAKELLALLVDRQGKFVSSGEIISCLWEDEPVSDNTRSRCRKAAFHLRETLEGYGLDELIESTSKGYRRIRTEMIDCDLYHYLAGDSGYKRTFRGAYMTDYSWAEQTLTSLIYEKITLETKKY